MSCRKAGTAIGGGGVPPASRSKTVKCSESRLAMTEPAVPPPTEVHATQLREFEEMRMK